MADFSALKTSIQNYIKQNGNEEITGNLLQQVLLSMVTTLGDSAINDLVTALNAEIANRGNADTTLQGNIDNEATARGNADTELDGRITTLQGVVNGVIANVENGYVYAGIATPSSTPASGKVFYLALTAGTYTNFGATVVPQGINILKYNGSAWSLDSFLGLDDAPTQGSNNLVKSGGVLDSIIKDGSAFDLSAYNNGTTYADLSAALTALNALPAAYKKGGMSMKFVQSSDNKYVQYRYMGTEITGTPNPFLDVNNWQGVDDVPTVGSDNLVKSGGVYNIMGLVEIVYPLKGYRINEEGIQTTEQCWESSDFIKVEDIEVKYLLLRNTNGITGAVYFYDEYYSPISGITQDGDITKDMYIVPAGAYYVRFSRASIELIPGYTVLVSYNVIKEIYKIEEDNIVQMVNGTTSRNNIVIPKNIYPISITKAIFDNTNYFTLVKNSTIPVYLADGTKQTFYTYAISELFHIQEGLILTGTLIASRAAHICAIVWFDSNRNFISGIYKDVQITTYITIDTRETDMAIPANAAYFAVQGPTLSPWFENQSLYGLTSLEGVKSDIYNLKKQISGNNPLTLLWPRTIYNVGNNIVMGKNNFPRNYSTCLYIDNFLPNRLTYEPKIFFEDKKILKAIPCYEPPMPNFTGLDGSWETPKMNNGQDLYTETIALKINNSGTMQTRNIQNRCVLNSAAKNKRIAILCIGDSITFGQSAYFTESPNKANYTMLLSEMFKKDNLQEGSGYEFDTIGTIKYNRIFSYNGQDYNIPCFNEGYAGTSMQQTGLFTNPKFLDDNNNFSFNNWLNKYRTRDDDGNQLYFDENGATTGVGGNYGFYENGTQSSFRIGTEVTDVTLYNVYKPTHIFLFHCTNKSISKSDYDTFISYVRDVFPDAFIGLGAPHMAGTYYPSYWPQHCNCERWNNMLNYSDADNRQYSSEIALLQIADDSSYEEDNVFVLSTFFVNPSADAIPGLAVSHPYNDFIQGGDIYMPKGQCPQAHVGGKAHAAYAYQLYGWTKWTSVNRDS